MPVVPVLKNNYTPYREKCSTVLMKQRFRYKKLDEIKIFYFKTRLALNAGYSGIN